MAQVQNKGMKNAVLNVGGTVVKSDENGVFEVDTTMASKLLALPGFSKPKMTRELEAAYAIYKTANEQLVRAQAEYDAAKLKVATAQAQAERGGGTPLEGAPAPVQNRPAAPAEPQAPATPPPSPEKPSEQPKTVGSPDAKAAAASLRARLGRPTMRWKFDDLVTLAQSHGVEADSTWSKADILKAIEDSEEAEE